MRVENVLGTAELSKESHKTKLFVFRILGSAIKENPNLVPKRPSQNQLSTVLRVLNALSSLVVPHSPCDLA